MYKIPIKYNDIDGNPIEETFYFNLTKAEITELEFSYGGGLTAVIQQLSEKNEVGRVIEIIKDTVLKAYGERITDRTGRDRFVKTSDARESFAATDAYSELFMSFVKDPDAFNEFLIGVMPVDMQADIRAEMNAAKDGKVPATQGSVAPPKAVR